MNVTRIEYLDLTWNPFVGCSGVNCAVRAHCWAMGQAKRMKHKCGKCYSFTPHYHHERFNQPLEVKKPSRIGVGFMGDIFDKGFDATTHQILFNIMKEAHWHGFFCLTKQSANMVTFNENLRSFPENVCMGVTVNRKADLYRIDDLRKTDAAIKFVSFEPLYENLGGVYLEGIQWAVIGGQTGPTWYPDTLAVNDLMSQLRKKDIPIFLKNNLGRKEKVQEYSKPIPSSISVL